MTMHTFLITQNLLQTQTGMQQPSYQLVGLLAELLCPSIYQHSARLHTFSSLLDYSHIHMQ